MKLLEFPIKEYRGTEYIDPTDIKKIMTESMYEKFEKYMRGQTGILVPSSHGAIYGIYPCDLENFINRKPHL